MITQQPFLSKTRLNNVLVASLIIVCALSIFINNTYAESSCEREFDVLKRTGGSSYRYDKEILKDLSCTQRFEGKSFKIVEGISDIAIGFDADEELLRRASTVYFHLTEAKNYWINQINSEYAKNLPSLTIRVNMGREYSRLIHFAKKDTESNNAWTIPAGKSPKSVPKNKQKLWGDEIWFSPMKVVDTEELADTLGANPVTTSLQLIEDPIIRMAESSFIYDSINLMIEPEYADQTFEQIVITNLLTVATIKGIVFSSTFFDTIFVEDEYYIDTAMVPEIIHHEFAHIVLGENLKPVHSVAVIEGMADYFAASALDRPDLYTKMKGILLSRAKDANNDTLYSPIYDLKNNANRDFALSVLWKVRKNLESLNRKRLKLGKSPVVNIDHFVYEARKSLDEESLISSDLTRALIKTCKKMCKNPRSGIDAIRKALEDKGFN